MLLKALIIKLWHYYTYTHCYLVNVAYEYVVKSVHVSKHLKDMLFQFPEYLQNYVHDTVFIGVFARFLIKIGETLKK